MFICECDNKDLCGRLMSMEVYDILSARQGDSEDLFIVHEDHAGKNDEEIQREGEWVLVRAVAGGSNE